MSIPHIGWLIYCLAFIVVTGTLKINVVVLTQNFPCELQHAVILKKSLQDQRVYEDDWVFPKSWRYVIL